MPESRHNLDSLFEAALEIASPEGRAEFLATACGADQALLHEVEKLLAADRAAGSFLEKPSPELLSDIGPGADEEFQSAIFEARLKSAFGADASSSQPSLSVLKSLGQSCELPQVILRDAGTELDSIVQPMSSEMPRARPDSRYHLLGEIARGGMGAILKGRDIDLGRDLAIKVLLESHKDKPEVIQRFIEEAQIGGQLQHPGIAPVYELGQFADRRPFFSMKLVKGETLSKLLSDRAAPSVNRGKLLGIFVQVCQTMAYAHSRGVIHRDLKPANIMVGAFGEVQVMDWGLAKVLPAGGVADERKSRSVQQGHSIVQTLRSTGSEAPGSFGSGSSQTQIGSVLGTPAYMPPEQALGEIDLMDERTDVFGLGAILCELLTGKPPYVGEDGAHTFQMAYRGKLEECFARLDACEADTELLVLTKHCLELEPKDRPRDAGILAERVSEYLQSVDLKLRRSEMAQAAQAARLEQQQRSNLKLHKLIAVLAVVAMIAVGTSLIAGHYWQQADIASKSLVTSELQARQSASAADRNAQTARKSAAAARQSEETARREAKRASAEKKNAEQNLAKALKAEGEANAQSKRADNSAEVATRNLHYAQMHLGLQVWREHRGEQYLQELLRNWIPQPGALDHRGWEWFYLNSLPHQNLRTLVESNSQHPGRCAVAWHVPSGRLAMGTDDGQIRIWDVEKQQVIKVLKATAATPSFFGGKWVAWSPDGSQLAAGCHDGTLHIWDTSSGEKIRYLRESLTAICAIAYSADGQQVAAFSQDGKIRVWDLPGSRLAYTVTHSEGVSVGAWSPDNKQFATGHMDGTVTISKTDPAAQPITFRPHPDIIYQLEWSPDSTSIATTSASDFFVSVWDAASQKMLLGPLRHSHGILALAWNADGRLASGGMDETAKVWDMKTGQPVCTLRGVRTSISSLAWGPGGRLASAAIDCNVRIWTSIRNQESVQLPGHAVRTTAVAWSPDGKRLASGGEDGYIRVWNPSTNEEPVTLNAHDNQQVLMQYGLIRSIDWSPNGEYLASAGLDGITRVWDLATQKDVLTLTSEHGPVWAVAWNHTGNRLAAGTEKGFIVVVDGLPDAPKTQAFKAHDVRVRSLRWDPTGDRLASGSIDYLTKVWDPNLKAELARFTGNDGWVVGLAWSRDGKTLVTGASDRFVRTWNAQTGQLLTTMRGHNDYVEAVAWNPDGTQVASAALDNSVRIWDTKTGEEAFVLRGDSGMFHDLSWSKDGAKLAAACSDGRIWIWDATNGFERDTTDRAYPYLERRLASGTARSEDLEYLVEYYIRNGKIDEVLVEKFEDPVWLIKIAQLTESKTNSVLAAKARTKAISLLKQRLVADPRNAELTSQLADLLLADNKAEWTVIQPTELRSTGGATLTLQNDGSILVSGTNAPGDVYTVTARTGVDHIGAVRIEALPDRSLPANGPGRHSSGNFHLGALRLYRPSDKATGERIPIPLISAAASFDYREKDADIAGILDESLNKFWHIWSRIGQSHEAVISVDEAGTDHQSQPLIIELRHRIFREPLNLGHFRLSVRRDAPDLRRVAARKLDEPWARLALAYDILGDRQAVDHLRQQSPSLSHALANAYADVHDWDRAIAEYSYLLSRNPDDTSLLAQRGVSYLANKQWDMAKQDWHAAVAKKPELIGAAFNHFKIARQWEQTAEFGYIYFNQRPKDGLLWADMSTILASSGNKAAYEKFNLRALEGLSQMTGPQASVRAIEACLILPGIIPALKLQGPAEKVIQDLEAGTVLELHIPWAWTAEALFAWRRDDAESAVKYANKSEENRPEVFCTPINLCIRAMAEHRLHRFNDARATLEKATTAVAGVKGSSELKGSHHVLFAEILLQEAEQLINGK